MANPNIVQVSSILGKTAFLVCSTTEGTLVAGVTNKVLKINSIYATNITGASTHDVSVAIKRGGVNYWLSFTISVPGDATLIVVSKDTAVYLEETDSIIALASSASVIHCVVSYEEIS